MEFALVAQDFTCCVAFCLFFVLLHWSGSLLLPLLSGICGFLVFCYAVVGVGVVFLAFGFCFVSYSLTSLYFSSNKTDGCMLNGFHSCGFQCSEIDKDAKLKEMQIQTSLPETSGMQVQTASNEKHDKHSKKSMSENAKKTIQNNSPCLSPQIFDH